MKLIKAFTLGIGDGWTQPYELSTSWNIDHLHTGNDNIYEWLDRGINVGQFARAGFKSQAWQLGYWPFSWNGKG